MDTNYIKKDGFSNPDTERLFASWSDARVAATVKALKDCGACVYANFLVDSPQEYEWLLCLNEDSPFHLETLNWAFGCPAQERDYSVENVILPGDDSPDAPPSFGRTEFDLGLDDEHE